MKILIVDDERLARERLVSLLSELDNDFSISEAEHGVEALRLISEEPPELVLLDIRMPVMDGLEVAHHLSGLESPPSIIFTTAYQEYALNAFDAHAVDYLMKKGKLSPKFSEEDENEIKEVQKKGKIYGDPLVELV